jgi:hypothetical protein
LGEGRDLVSQIDFDHGKFIEGTFLPGKYLLGVRRTTESEFSSEYGIIFASEDLISP